MSMVLKVFAAIFMSLMLAMSASADETNNCYGSKFDKVQKNRFSGGRVEVSSIGFPVAILTLEFFDKSSGAEKRTYKSEFVPLGQVIGGPFKGMEEARVRNGENREIETIYFDVELVDGFVMPAKKSAGRFVFINSKGEQDWNICYPKVVSEPENEFRITDAYVGATNVKLIAFEKMPAVVRSAFADIDMGFELGDGYYSLQTNAYYSVANPKTGKIEGYMEAGLLTYTEDPEYVVAAAFVNLKGSVIQNRDGAIVDEQDRFSMSDKESLAALPPELQPSPEE